jgi:hypothetical protein
VLTCNWQVFSPEPWTLIEVVLRSAHAGGGSLRTLRESGGCCSDPQCCRSSMIFCMPAACALQLHEKAGIFCAKSGCICSDIGWVIILLSVHQICPSFLSCPGWGHLFPKGLPPCWKGPWAFAGLWWRLKTGLSQSMVQLKLRIDKLIDRLTLLHGDALLLFRG